MPKIIFKQRHRDRTTKEKYTAQRNVGKLEYIGDKPEALKNEISGNGLFGYVQGEYSDAVDMKNAQAYIRKMTAPNRDIFHAVYSFDTHSAEEAGLQSAKDWQCWTKYRIAEIAKHMNMKIENIEWYASVHLKAGQPHVHLMWWDVQQKITINVVDPVICDNIRIAATTNTYRGYYTELHNQEDAKLKEMRSLIAENTNAMLHSDNPLGADAQIVAMLNHIYKELPQKGNLLYKYMPAKVKSDLNKLTAYLITNTPELRDLYDDIITARRLYNEALHSAETNWGKYKLAKYEGQLNDDINTGVGNTILKLLRREKDVHRNALYESLNIPEPDMEQFTEELVAAPNGGEDYIYWSKDFKAARSAVNNDKDIARALELYAAEAAKGNALAKYEIADLYRRGLVYGEAEAEDIYAQALQAFTEIEAANEKMRPYLQYRIGRMHYDGYGTNQDYAEALVWLEKSAQGGNHLSEYTVAKMYHKGIGTTQDITKAEQYYSAAADGNNIYAACALGKMYLDGTIPGKSQEGVKLLEKVISDAKDDYKAYAQYVLGAAYHYNDDIRDDGKARELLAQSAEGGNQYAAALIAHMDAANIVNLLRASLAVLRNAQSSTNRALSEMSYKVFGRGDLSKEAIAELIYRLQDKQNTAEM